MRVREIAPLLITLLAICVLGCTTNTNTEPEGVLGAPEDAAPAAPTDIAAAGRKLEQAPPAGYQIMEGERGNKSLPIGAMKRYSRDIVVPRDASDEEIAAVLNSALDEFRELHRDADALMVGAFIEGSTGVAYAHLYWAADGGEAWGNPSGTIKWQSERPPAVDEGERFGLSLSERKQAFLDLVAAENRAMDEAMEKYPDDLDRQVEFQRSLMSEYKKTVREEYGLTEEQESQLVVEAMEQHWPMH